VAGVVAPYVICAAACPHRGAARRRAVRRQRCRAPPLLGDVAPACGPAFRPPVPPSA